MLTFCSSPKALMEDTIDPLPMRRRCLGTRRILSGLQTAIFWLHMGVRRSPYGQRACLSHDGGQTWEIENEIILRDDAPNGDLGYPSTVELDPGELLTTYYQIDRVGEKTSFFATRWSLD